MTKMKIKKDDMAVVTIGKDKGKVAQVMECFPKQNKVLLKGLNIVVKHNKPKSAQDKGGIVKKEGKIEVSNVMIVCPVCHKATRVKIGLNAKNEKVRLCKKCGATLDSNVKKVVEKKVSSAKSAEAKPALEEKAKEVAVKTEKKTTAKKAPAKVSQKHETKTTVKTARATTVRKSASTAKKIGGK